MVLHPAITDTNFLLQISAAMARRETHGSFDAIRKRCFITRSVDEETTDRSRSRARSRFNVDPDDMHRAWMHQVRPHLRVVDIDGDELQHDAIDQVRARDADQADIDTAALAVLLSPCLVITGDDDLRAVASPHLAPDVRRSIRHAEPTPHAVARNRIPLVAQHAFVQGATVGGVVAADMSRELVAHLLRNPLGRLVLSIAGGSLVLASTNQTFRAKVAGAARTIGDIAGEATLAAIAAERDCAARIFPAVDPQSLAHRIAQHVAHYPLWLDPNGIASALQLEPDDAHRACRHKWFSIGVFGSIKIGNAHDAPLEIEAAASTQH